MFYITQLIYVVKGQEAVFDQFEKMAIPLIGKYRGQLLLRLRPNETAYIDSHIEQPYEIHLVEFASEKDFEDFAKDEERKKFLHLKEQSVRALLMIKGVKI